MEAQGAEGSPAKPPPQRPVHAPLTPAAPGGVGFSRRQVPPGAGVVIYVLFFGGVGVLGAQAQSRPHPPALRGFSRAEAL